MKIFLYTPKEGMRLKMEQATDNVRDNTRRRLQKRVPSFLRTVFGSDVSYRIWLQLFKRDELRKPVSKSGNADGNDAALSED